MANNKYVRLFNVSMVISVFIIGLDAAPTLAQFGDLFGAISYSPSSGVYGSSSNYPTRSTAKNKAHMVCELESNSDDCETIISFKNACGALANKGKTIFAAAIADTLDTAELKALEECNKKIEGSRECTVTYSVCT